MELNKTFAEILHFIKAHRNGDAAQRMKDMGLIYNMNYGVSLLNIKEFLKTIPQNQELALKLWNEPLRETKLFALYLFEPAQCDSTFIHSLLNSLQNTELSEQAAWSVFCYSQLSQETLLDWCRDDSQTVKLAGYNTIIRKLKTGNMPQFDFGVFFDMLYHEIETDAVLPQKSVSFALTEIARKGNKPLVEQFVQKIETINTKQSRFIVDNVNNELEYL